MARTLSMYVTGTRMVDARVIEAQTEVVSYTKNLGQTLIEEGIRVNAVAPGPVWTPLIAATMPPDMVKSFGEQAPIGRAAQPVKLAPAYVFLASQESSYIAGETIAVTGGKPLV
jgi:NAD(P)-dependent dehydrogenase (short-subunit alcohol dehydrogenase family)